MVKFGLAYQLKVEAFGGKETIEIGMPFSIQFSITRSMTGSANTASITIFNLNEVSREKIFKDEFDIDDYRAVQLFAGYDDGANTLLPMVFNGHLRKAGSKRNGTEWETELDCFDGAYAMTEGKMSLSVPAGQSMKDTLLNAMGNLPKIAGAVVGDGFDSQNKRGQVLFENPAEFLKMQSKNRFFIDNNNAYILADNETLKGDIETIDVSTGLIGTPRRQKNIIELETIFEPRLTLAQDLEVISQTNPGINGVYKVIEIVHSGNISPSVASTVTTNVKLNVPATALKRVKGRIG
jgi:hypothetical protein